MSAEQNKAIARQWFKDIDGGHGSLAFTEKWPTPDFKSHVPGLPEPVDLVGYREMVSTYLTAFPQMRHEVHFMVAEDDLVAAIMTLHVVHTGEFQGILPTGRKASVSEIVVLRIRDGKVCKQWFVLDSASLLQQLGATALPAGAES